jgi:phosphatidate cytidylyltransferase
MVRLATAAVLAPALWVLIKLVPPLAFFLAALVVIALASWECYRMLEARGARPFKVLGLSACAAVAWSFVGLAPRFDPQLPLVFAVTAAVGFAMLCRPSPEGMLDAAVNTLFPVGFVGLALGYVVGLRAIPGEDGEDLVLLLFLCVIFADTAALYVGTRFGRRSMSPVLSPRKSWEGAAGGLLGSIVGALVAHVWFYQRLSVVHALTLGVIIAGTALAGDLAESMVKRAAGVKDSSRILPGHGGVLDRTDSLLFAGPVLFYYYRWFIQGAA